MNILSNRPLILEGESFASYAHRLATGNYLNSLIAFTPHSRYRIANINCNTPCEQVIENISKATNQERARLRAMTILPFQEQVDARALKALLLKEKIRYCPHCIEQVPHHKTKWMFRCVTLCLEHQILLVDRCQECDSFLTMEGLFNRICTKCSKELLMAASERVSPSSIIMESQRDLQALMENDPSEFASRMVLAQHTFHLLQGLPSFIGDPSMGIDASVTVKDGFKTLRSAIAYANFYWVFQDFPNNFHLLLDEFLKNTSFSKSDRKRKFEALFRHERFNWVKEEYDRFWVLQVEEGVTNKNVTVFKDGHPLVRSKKTLSETLKEYKLHHDQVHRLFRSNAIQGKQIHKGKSVQYFFEKESLDALADQKAQLLSRPETAKKIGVSLDQLGHLVKAGMLAQSKLQIGKGGSYDPVTVEAFVSRYRGTFTKKKGRGILFMDAVRVNRVDGLSLVKLLQLIDQKQLVPVTNKRNGNLSFSMVDELELTKCIETWKVQRWESEGYTASELTKVLRCSYRTVLKLTDAQILVPHRVVISETGCKIRYYNKAQIDLFLKEKHRKTAR